MSPSTDRTLVRLRRTAWVCLAAMAATVMLSATMRLRTGLPADGVLVAARIAHRVVATVVLLGAVAIALWAAEPTLRRERPGAWFLLVLVLALAALGVATPGATRPLVAIGNLVGGLATLGVCARLAFGRGALPGLRGWAGAALLALLVQAAIGAQVGAVLAVHACDALADCWRAGGDWAWLDPFASPPAATEATNRAAAPAQLVHRAFALGVAAAMLALAVLAWRRRARVGAVLLVALVAAQFFAGWAIAAGATPPQPAFAPALLHHALAAAMVVVLVRWR